MVFSTSVPKCYFYYRLGILGHHHIRSITLDLGDLWSAHALRLYFSSSCRAFPVDVLKMISVSLVRAIGRLVRIRLPSYPRRRTTISNSEPILLFVHALVKKVDCISIIKPGIVGHSYCLVKMLLSTTEPLIRYFHNPNTKLDSNPSKYFKCYRPW